MRKDDDDDEVRKSLMRKISKEDEQTLAESNSAHRRSQAKCQLVQTNYIKRIKLTHRSAIIRLIHLLSESQPTRPTQSRSQPTAPTCVVWSWRLKKCFTHPRRLKTNYIGLKVPSLPDGYNTMLMGPNKAETAVHGFHCTVDMAVRMRKVLRFEMLT